MGFEIFYLARIKIGMVLGIYMAKGRDMKYSLSRGEKDILKKLFFNVTDCHEETSLDEYSNRIICMDKEILLSKRKLSHLGASFNMQHLLVVTNPDGSIRWIIPAQLNKALFLVFYNQSGYRSFFIALFFKLLYTFKLHRIALPSLYIYYRSNDIFIHKLKEISNGHYTIFTGTSGPNRKSIGIFRDNTNNYSFFKVPLGNLAKQRLENEYHSLERFPSYGLEGTTFPTATNNKGLGIDIYSDIRTTKVKRVDKLNNAHIKVLKSLYNNTSHTKQLSDFDLVPRLEVLAQNIGPNDPAIFGHLMRLLGWIIEGLGTKQEVWCSVSHGDFTPWNCYVDMDGQGLLLYDFEMSHKSEVLLYDFVHFIIQQGVLVEYKTASEIKFDIWKTFEDNNLGTILTDKYIDLGLYYKLSLIKLIIHYLEIFIGQKDNLHMQADWLMNCWRELLVKELVPSPTNQRKVFLSLLNMYLDTKGARVLKTFGRHLEQLPIDSDVDIACTYDKYLEVISQIESVPFIQKIEVRRLHYMNTVKAFFEDGSMVSMDFIFSFERKGLQLIQHDKLVQKKQGEQQAFFKDLEYIVLFYFLNGSGIPQKYISYFLQKPKNKQEEINELFRNKYQLPSFEYKKLANYDPIIKAGLLKKVRSFKNNNIFDKAYRKALYYIFLIGSALNNKGKVITISGVDGAGKSTIIRLLAQKLDKEQRKRVVVLRHRPSVLPILSSLKYGKKKAMEIAANLPPHSGQKQSLLSSWMRFTYYYMDYLIGQIYIYCRYVLLGTTVVYDRYYFDFINDPERSNLSTNRGMASFFYAFLIKPNLNVFLYAPVEIIRERKKELSPDVISTLTNKYKDTFEYLGKKFGKDRYLIINNIELENTLNQILKSI